MKALQLISISTALLTVSAPTLAAPNCGSYVPGLNKTMDAYISVAGPKEWKDLALNKFADPVNNIWGQPVLTLSSYKLPESVSKKLMVKITDSATKGTRVANGRLVCSFRIQTNDGYKVSTGTLDFDIEPFSDVTAPKMYFSPGQAFSGEFRAQGLAQEYVNLAIAKTVSRDPKYAGQFQRQPD